MESVGRLADRHQEPIACFARQPSYVSAEWALNYHGVLLQVPTVCTAVTLYGASGRRNRIRFGGVVIEYSRIKESLYSPDQIEGLEGVLMATPEKALLDTIYLRRRIPFADELVLDGLSAGRLRSIANLYPNVVGQRLAALLQGSEKRVAPISPSARAPGGCCRSRTT